MFTTKTFVQQTLKQKKKSDEKKLNFPERLCTIKKNKNFTFIQIKKL